MKKNNKNRKPVFVDESIEGHAISPAGGEVTYVNIGVASSLHLAPQQQCIFGTLYFTVVHLFDCYVLNLSFFEVIIVLVIFLCSF